MGKKKLSNNQMNTVLYFFILFFFQLEKKDISATQTLRSAFMKVSPVRMDGWVGNLRFYILFNSISVISGQWADDYERLCAMGLHLRLRRFCLEQGLNLGLLDQ